VTVNYLMFFVFSAFTILYQYIVLPLTSIFFFMEQF